MRAILLLLLLGNGLGLPGIARGQACSSPMALGSMNGITLDRAVGQWAEYGTLDDTALDRGFFRVFAVDAPWQGERVRWLELWFDRTGRVALRLLVEGQGKAPVMLLKRGPTIFRLPDAAIESTRGCKAGPPVATDTASVRTPAGSFVCRHVRRSTERGPIDLWQSDDVMPLTLVRVRSPVGGGYELLAKGSGAKTAFPDSFKTVAFPTIDAINALIPADFRNLHERARAGAPDGGQAMDAGVAQQEDGGSTSGH